MISDTLARTMFPNGSPIGHRYGVSEPEHANDLEVIGVVKDVKFGSLQEDQQTLDYFPVTQQIRYLNDFEVRYAGSLDAVPPAVRRAIHEVDPNLPISNVTTLEEQVGRSITNQRLVGQLST